MATRRGFLAGLGAIATIGVARVASAAAEPADTHTYHGYTVTWRPWAPVPNQWGEIAFWAATISGDPDHFYAATTFGVVDRYYKHDALQTHLEWKDVSPHPSTAERPVVKARALRLLYDFLETPQPCRT